VHAHITIVPTEAPNAQDNLDAAAKALKKSGLSEQALTSGMSIDGAWDHVMHEVRRVHNAVESSHARVVMTIMISGQPDGDCSPAARSKRPSESQIHAAGLESFPCSDPPSLQLER